MVEYFVGPDAMEAFIFQSGKTPVWYSFVNSSDFNSLAWSFIHYFQNQQAILNDPSGYMSTAYALWQQLLPPELASAAKLTLIPDGILNQIPFDALVTAQPAPGLSLRQAPYLIRKQEIHYAWSLNVLQQQKKLHATAKNYALSLAPGFANGERGLAPLATDEREWPHNSTALLGNSADLQHFLEAVGNYQILHLSTHAVAAVYSGELTRLELFDQSLYLPSIYALPLQADLVTLSACQTGLGSSYAGEGVMSLSRAFAQAGAACVISSLWSVNDQSTRQLLAGFYQRLAAGEPIGQSLRAAKLGYLDDPDIRGAMQTPYCWAGLTMVGDNRVVSTGGYGWKGWLTGALILLLITWYVRVKRKR
jgi:CHAT domain-containing protein